MVKENELILLHNRLFKMTDVIIEGHALPYHKTGTIILPLCSIFLLLSLVFAQSSSDSKFLVYSFCIFASVFIANKTMYDYMFQSEGDSGLSLKERKALKLKKLQRYIKKEDLTDFSINKFFYSFFSTVTSALLVGSLLILPGLLFETFILDNPLLSNFSFGVFHLLYLLFISLICVYLFNENIKGIEKIKNKHNNLDKDFLEVDKAIENLLSEIEGDYIFKLYTLKNESKKSESDYLEYYLDLKIKDQLKENGFTNIEDYFIKQRNQNMLINENTMIIENS